MPAWSRRAGGAPFANGRHQEPRRDLRRRSDFNGSTSSPATSHVVAQAQTTTALTAAPNPVPGGTQVTLTATVSATAPASGPPNGASYTGTVDFYDGATLIAAGVSVSASGVATATTSFQLAGMHAVHAVYSGDANYARLDVGGRQHRRHEHERSHLQGQLRITGHSNPLPKIASTTIRAETLPAVQTGTAAIPGLFVVADAKHPLIAPVTRFEKTVRGRRARPEIEREIAAAELHGAGNHERAVRAVCRPRTRARPCRPTP
jgi:hypothetical protein